MLNTLSQNSVALLYLLQAATYAAAALFARREDHVALTQCYLASALLHGLFGACHAMHLG
ncbi:hypothetical protein DFR50_12516 [Roseiarcus fermentans]|uniref:Uncharacterized protein n=1 Tax=Roseiarcus fermentans TaxID=1473586 RepID=A0A366F1R0_9HYPH|nr:hypothetical protein [Roseiarcus fermentans]RBP08534.1 hypothetical protein DFR50_12516 [Roseiarcus fermentans]